MAKGLKVPNNILPDHLPPYSPQYNQLEQLWKWSRINWFHNLYFKSLTEVEEALEKALVTLVASPTLVPKPLWERWSPKIGQGVKLLRGA